ncbi:MAG: hypothetical protein QE495_14550 [Acidovorax sp.]|uniref:DUF2946 family protein n=1 Tax=Acidovorax sp. TaxID=1872122 RepID=UPI00260DFE2F|nr:DUF2946 family protein [Acidovorax sp.]MDH4427671.1 hypothetical protein [Acidovorax sp.]MDH4464088.1 hypothetical protein [Acidovorax sp.]
MRRAWIHRFMGLLWLALCSTAVLPWAHELSHLTEHAPVAWAPAATGDTTDRASDHEDRQAAEGCLVCLHLLSEHLAPTGRSGTALALSGPIAPPALAGRSAHAPPGWLTPATRAPPAVTA